MTPLPEADGFLSRWSRRKALAREGQVLPEPPAPAPRPAPVAVAQPTHPAEPPPAAVAEAPAPPPLTLADTEPLTPQSDFTRFVAQGVSPEVKNAALKKLFSDPHFNVMDGLDTYIEDYGRPDPLPASTLRQMAQARFLGLFQEEDEELKPAPDEDTDLRLQPDDAARPAGPAPGPGSGAGHGG
ncbi:MAG: DUF3306 domain-containing protein [Pseudomonadota bacterium]